MLFIFSLALLVNWRADQGYRWLHWWAAALSILFFILAVFLYPKDSFVFLLAVSAALINIITSVYKALRNAKN